MESIGTQWAADLTVCSSGLRKQAREELLKLLLAAGGK